MEDEARYPRSGEPIVPRLLAPLLRPLPGRRRTSIAGHDLASLRARTWGSLTHEESDHIGLLVIERVRCALLGAPRALLRCRLPGPEELVDRLVLERRTSDLLHQWIATGSTAGGWTIGRYLWIPGFGPRALVDMLAALEGKLGSRSNSRRRKASLARADRRLYAPSPPSAVMVAQSMEVVGPLLPLSEKDAQAALRSAGLASSPVTLSELAHAAAQLGYEPPFHVLEIGGTKVAVAQPHITAARAAYAVASRAVHNWGVATVRGVAEQVSVMVTGVKRLGFVERLLMAIATFEWLDSEGGWFWFVGRPNRLLGDLVKVFSVVARLPIAQLWRAVCRAQTGPEQPPPSILPRVCAALPALHLRDDVVEATQLLLGPPRISPAEKRLVGVLERVERPLAVPEIRELTMAAGLSWRAVCRLLLTSPLIEALPGPCYALIGT
jgi:hypothetical protein